jgi:hypothetical protein
LASVTLGGEGSVALSTAGLLQEKINDSKRNKTKRCPLYGKNLMYLMQTPIMSVGVIYVFKDNVFQKQSHYLPTAGNIPGKG